MEIIVGFLETWGTLIIAGCSLVVAVISLIKSAKAQRLQRKINEIEYTIKQFELDKIQAEKDDQNRACIEVKVLDISSKKHKMKVWNSGGATAKNIEIELEDNSGLILMADMLPYEELEARKSFDIPVVVYPSPSRKTYIVTKWIEQSGEIGQKRQLVSL